MELKWRFVCDKQIDEDGYKSFISSNSASEWFDQILDCATTTTTKNGIAIIFT